MDRHCHNLDISGKWSGKWESRKSGHRGPLHATLRRVDDCHYRARFHGRFWKVFPFFYTAKLTIVSETPDCVVLAGESRLLFFGTFRYHAQVTACDFCATYESRRDHGEFVMRRR
ncbi:MAG: hypothetical protein KatS3mg105_2937 [Gemmatales bacterium]|nr:MAG: hypothetical protein KatS3mg105_2937 [Gemmatales bacterium]